METLKSLLTNQNKNSMYELANNLISPSRTNYKIFINGELIQYPYKNLTNIFYNSKKYTEKTQLSLNISNDMTNIAMKEFSDDVHLFRNPKLSELTDAISERSNRYAIIFNNAQHNFEYSGISHTIYFD